MKCITEQVKASSAILGELMRIFTILAVVGFAITLLLSNFNLTVKIPKQLEKIENLIQAEQEAKEEVKEVTEKLDQKEAEIKQLEKELQAKRESEAYLASLPTGCKAVEPIVRKYFGDQTSLVMAIMRAESGCNSTALNGQDNHGSCTGSYGLMQIGCFWFGYYGHSITYDPEINIKIAYNIYKRQGSFNAWSAYKTGAYLRYL